jgi:hypothetical protein
MTNVFGSEKKRISNLKNGDRIDLSNIQPGLYMYKVNQGNSVIYTGKLIKMN